MTLEIQRVIRRAFVVLFFGRVWIECLFWIALDAIQTGVMISPIVSKEFRDAARRQWER